MPVQVDPALPDLRVRVLRIRRRLSLCLPRRLFHDRASPGSHPSVIALPLCFGRKATRGAGYSHFRPLTCCSSSRDTGLGFVEYLVRTSSIEFPSFLTLVSGIAYAFAWPVPLFLHRFRARDCINIDLVFALFSSNVTRRFVKYPSAV